MKNCKTISIIAVLTFLAVPSMAYFRDIGVGVRPTGMGGVYVAISDDANAVLWNASGIAQASKQEITAMYSALYTGLDAKLYIEETDKIGYHFISYIHPAYKNIGAFGFSWATFQSWFYDENTFSLSVVVADDQHLSLGVTLPEKLPGLLAEGRDPAEPRRVARDHDDGIIHRVRPLRVDRGPSASQAALAGWRWRGT